MLFTSFVDCDATEVATAWRDLFAHSCNMQASRVSERALGQSCPGARESGYIKEATRMRVLVLLVLPLLVSAVARGQIPPGQAEIDGYSELHSAAWYGKLEAIRASANRASVNVRDSYGRTPLHIATYARQRDAVRALVRSGADLGALEEDRYDAVTIAAVADDEETLALLLELGASAKLVTSRYDGTALIAAAHLGHDGVVRQLIAAGAPLDHINNLHWTALIEAVVLGDGTARHQATVKALLEAGADPSLTDRNGHTPLELARERGYKAIETLILKFVLNEDSPTRVQKKMK